MAELTLTGPVPQDVPDEPPTPIYNEQFNLTLNNVRRWCSCKIGGGPPCTNCKASAVTLLNSESETKMCNQRHTDDSDDILALPTINWAEPIDQPTRLPGDPVDVPGITFNDIADFNNSGPVTNSADDDDILRLPVVNWSSAG